MSKLPPSAPSTTDDRGRARHEAKRPTCVHCVTTRAAARLGRHYARPFTLWSYATQAPVVAMDGPELYALVSHLLRDAAESCPGEAAVRVRIVSDVHPEIHILAAAGAQRATHVRTLAVPRHAAGSLAGGFAEGFGGDATRTPNAVGA